MRQGRLIYACVRRCVVGALLALVSTLPRMCCTGLAQEILCHMCGVAQTRYDMLHYVDGDVRVFRCGTT